MTEDFSRVMKGNIMGKITILLVFLCQFQGSQHLKIKDVQFQKGQKVKMECTGETGDSMDQGTYWFLQRKNGKNPEGIAYISGMSKTSFNQQFSAEKMTLDKQGNVFTLTIKSFQDTDQATYYCMIMKNLVLTFSPGLQLFYPAATTHKPTTTKPLPATSAKGSKSGDDCTCNSGKTETAKTNPEFWKIDCNIHIWAPLAGLCGFLLICLLVTAIMLCCRTRRRRCRCKHSPLDEKNGQMKPMNRYKK